MRNNIPIDLKKKAGIYRILNSENGKVYIGSTSQFQQRYSKHLHELKSDKHPSKHLQSSYNKYGSDSFQFDVLEVVDLDSFSEEDLLQLENHLIQKHKSNKKRFGYNLRISAESNYGVTHSPDAGTRVKGRKLPPSTRQKMSESRSGEKHHGALLSVEEVKKIKVFIHQGFRNINIARHLGVKKSVINDIKNGGGWSSVQIDESDIERLGEEELVVDVRTRLSSSRVKLIKYLLEQEVPRQVIAKYCEVKPRTVSDIKTGKTYKKSELNQSDREEFAPVLDEVHVLVENLNEVRRATNKEHGFKGSSNPASKLTESDVLSIKEEILKGVDYRSIALTFGVNVSTISKIRTGDNWSSVTGFHKVRSGNRSGSSHPNSRYSDEVVLRIVKLHKKGLTRKEICEKVGAEKTFVNRVLRGVTRSNITGIKPR